MSVLGIRFPKQFSRSSFATAAQATNPVLTTNLAGTAYNAAGGLLLIPIAPARYSEVRKVVFHVSVRMNTASTKARLRIAACSSSAVAIVAAPMTLASGGIFSTVTSTPWTGSFTAAQLFSHAGTESGSVLPISTNQITGPTGVLSVEFDRFHAGSADFFAVWDSVAGVDVDKYLMFRPVIERTDGSTAAANASFSEMGVTVVQAPSSGNKTCTIVPLTSGFFLGSAAPTTYGTDYRGALFRYVADNWDNITKATILGFNLNVSTGINHTWKVGLHSLSAYEPTAFNLLYEEQFVTTNPSSQQTYFFRTADVKSYLVDGADHTAMFKDALATIPLPCAWLEIIQDGFENTECHHGPDSMRYDLAVTRYGSPATPLFDPTWYQSFPDDRILSQTRQLAFKHADVAFGTDVGLSIDANLGSNIIDLEVTSTTLQKVGVLLESTPQANVGTKFYFGPITSRNPINLAGQRKLVFTTYDGFSSTGETAGTARLIYALRVPVSEVPELGDIFDVEAFDPEGCASTAAGLGDPGVLVITNGSTLPQKFDPLAGSIEDAGVPEPFCDEPVPTSMVADVASSPLGGLGIGIYRYRYTFRNCCTGKESNPNDTDIVVDTSGADPAAEVTLNFTGVRIPGDPQICEICVYRTVVDGAFPVMAKVGCFDPDVSSAFVDDLSDAALNFTDNELSTLNGPMPCAPIVVDFRDRLFAMGDIPDLSPKGTVSVQNGSDIVTGNFEVEWTRCLEGKYIQIEGCCRPFEIACVMPPAEELDPPLGRLKLTEPYDCPDQAAARYTICGHPNRLWYSEPFEAEYWPKANFIDIEPGDGDRLSGAVSNFDSLVICKRRKTYVLRFSENPGLEVVCPTRLGSDIGCIAPRSFAQIHSGSVWLSDRGLAIFDGRSVEMIPESVMFDAFFTDPDNPNYVRRDTNGRVIGAVAVFYPKRQQYLLLLPTVQTVRGANLMMVWDTQLRNLTVYTFCQEFLSMTIGKDSDGNQRVYMGDTNGFVWLFDVGDNDGIGRPGSVGTVVGTVTAAGLDPLLGASYIEDSAASFIEGGLPGLAGLSGVPGLSGAFDGADLGLAGVCVFYQRADAGPDDPWQKRVVFAATATRLFVTPSFVNDAPDVGWRYMLGPIDFLAKFKPTSMGDDDSLKRNWRQCLVHEPELVTSIVRVQLLPDFQSSDDEEGTIVAPDGSTGQGHTFDMSFPKGRQVRPVGRNLYNFEQVVMSNFAPEQPIRIINHLLMIEAHTSK